MRALISSSVLIFAVVQLNQPPGEHPEAPRRLPESASQVSEVGDGNLDVRLSEAKLRLARLELRRATDINRRVPGVFQRETLDRLAQAVKVAEKELAFAKGEEHNLHAVHLLQLEAEVELAKGQLQAATEANQRTARTVSAINLERFQLRAEIARLTLARAREASNFDSTEAHLQWQVDRLFEEIQRLRSEIPLLSQPN